MGDAKSSSYTQNSLSVPPVYRPELASNMLSASPTCFLSDTSLLFSLLCTMYLSDDGSVNPRALSSLLTADCYWRGSDELDSLLRCRYTSVPYL